MLTNRLFEALAYTPDPRAASLQTRLNRCGTDEWSGTFTCRTPGCSDCRGRYIAKQRRLAGDRFAGRGNHELASLSLVIAATTDLDDLPAIVAKFRKDARNLFDGQRRRDGLWAIAEMLVWIEVDAISGEDFVLLGPDKQKQLGEMVPLMTWSSHPVWIVTAHGVICHPVLPLRQVATAFEGRWDGHNRVHLKPFDPDNSVATNLSGVINYASKHRCQMTFGFGRMSWPSSWAAEFYSFIHGWSRGFQSLRISIGRRGSKNSRCGIKRNQADRTSESDAIPLTFDHVRSEYSTLPTTYNWKEQDAYQRTTRTFQSNARVQAGTGAPWLAGDVDSGDRCRARGP